MRKGTNKRILNSGTPSTAAEDIAETVAFLNDWPQGTRDVSRIIELFQTADGLPRAALNNARLYGHPIMAELVKRLGRYRYSPYMAVPPSYTRTGRWSVNVFPSFDGIVGYDWFTNSRAVWAIIELVKAGLIHRLRRCELCNRWYFAKRESRRWCSEKCRRKHYLSTPRGKKKWRDYMRTYMAEYYSVKAARRG